MSPWWSWVLTLIGVTGWWLTGRRMWQGWAVAISVQVLWVAYAISTKQYGFLVAAVLYGGMAAHNLRQWLRPGTGPTVRRHEFDEQDITVLAEGLARRYGTPYDGDHRIRAVGLLAEVMVGRHSRDDTNRPTAR